MAIDPALRARLLRIADRLDGKGSLVEIEPEIRGNPGAGAVIVGGGDFLTLSGEANRIARDLRAAAAELRAIT